MTCYSDLHQRSFAECGRNLAEFGHEPMLKAVEQLTGRQITVRGLRCPQQTQTDRSD
jgi:hypothetical protein